MLAIENTALLVVDVQGKLASLMHDREALYAQLQKLVMGAKALGIPILWAEQNPERMGATIPELAERLRPLSPIAKMSFSCWGEPRFRDALGMTGRKQALLCGIEAHVCVCQTACDLVAAGYEVHVVADAVSSRTLQNRSVGLDRAREAGGHITSVEGCLFELLRTADHPSFRDILRLVR